MIVNKTNLFKKWGLKNFLLLFLLVGVGGCDFFTEPSGVLLKNEINASTRNYIRNNISSGLVEEGLLAYYDTTVSLNKSQSYILTNRSLVIYCEGFEDWQVGDFDCWGTAPHGTKIIALTDISKIYETDEWYDGTSCSPLVELCFYVSVYADKEYFFSTAWFNDGDLFYNELIKAWEKENFIGEVL